MSPWFVVTLVALGVTFGLTHGIAYMVGRILGMRHARRVLLSDVEPPANPRLTMIMAGFSPEQIRFVEGE